MIIIISPRSTTSPHIRGILLLPWNLLERVDNRILTFLKCAESAQLWTMFLSLILSKEKDPEFPQPPQQKYWGWQKILIPTRGGFKLLPRERCLTSIIWRSQAQQLLLRTWIMQAAIRSQLGVIKRACFTLGTTAITEGNLRLSKILVPSKKAWLWEIEKWAIINQIINST